MMMAMIAYNMCIYIKININDKESKNNASYEYIFYIRSVYRNIRP